MARDVKGYSGDKDRTPAGASDGMWLATGRRRLTWQECAVLQDFPTGHPFAGPADAKYRQIGNAVPPRLAEVVGRAALAAWGER
jgi:DNA (cytosine-5)-methyltransferase 1